MKKALLVLFTCIILVSVLVACQQQATTTTPAASKPATTAPAATTPAPTTPLEPFKVGMSAALTGPVAVSFAPNEETIRVMFADLNDRGGINGRKVQLYIEDDQGQPAVAASNAKKFTSLGVSMMISCSISATFSALIAECQAAKIPFISACAGPGNELPPNPDPVVFATGFETTSEATLRSYAIARQFPKGTSWGILSQDSPQGTKAGQLLVQQATALGLNPFMVQVASGTTDMSSIAPKFQNAAIITYTGAGRLDIELYKALIKTGWKGTIDTMTHQLPIEALIQNQSIFTTDIYALAYFAPYQVGTPEANHMLDLMKKYNATAIDSSNMITYGCEPIVEAAFKKAGYPATSEKLLAAMNSLTVDLRPIGYGTKTWTRPTISGIATCSNIFSTARRASLQL